MMYSDKQVTHSIAKPFKSATRATYPEDHRYSTIEAPTRYTRMLRQVQQLKEEKKELKQREMSLSTQN
jgi:hypothetical protein